MDLEALRREIDAVDTQLLELFLRRMDLAGQVARYKIDRDLPVLHPQREQEILQRRRDQAGPAMAPYAEELFQTLLKASRQLQQQLIDAGK